MSPLNNENTAERGLSSSDRILITDVTSQTEVTRKVAKWVKPLFIALFIIGISAIGLAALNDISSIQGWWSVRILDPLTEFYIVGAVSTAAICVGAIGILEVNSRNKEIQQLLPTDQETAQITSSHSTSRDPTLTERENPSDSSSVPECNPSSSPLITENSEDLEREISRLFDELAKREELERDENELKREDDLKLKLMGVMILEQIQMEGTGLKKDENSRKIIRLIRSHLDSL